MSRRTWHLIAYDIRGPKRYRGVYRCIRGYGRPVQYSVFLCHLTKRQLEELRLELKRLTEDEDRLLFVPICESCVKNVIEEGPEQLFDPEPPPFRIV